MGLKWTGLCQKFWGSKKRSDSKIAESNGILGLRASYSCITGNSSTENLGNAAQIKNFARIVQVSEVSTIASSRSQP